MGFWKYMLGMEAEAPPYPQEQRSANPLENPTIAISSGNDAIQEFFGQLIKGDVQLPPVTIETALEVPAVWDAVNFLARALANLPLHPYQDAGGDAKRIDGDLAMILDEAPNGEWTSFEWRRYTWQQVFTGGRGLSWIERRGVTPIGIWPMDPTLTTVARINGRKVYKFNGKDYSAADVIDIPFMLKTDQIASYSPILKHRKTIGLAIAMNNFAGNFFGNGGMPPLSLEGPLPSGADSFKRAVADIKRSVDMARAANSAFFAMPPGHSLKQVGIEPDKGQMSEARLFQIQEIARIYGLPPVFLQDLSKGTFANTEQQDLQLVKHLIAHWAKAFEDELNLKLFGQRRRKKYVKHNLDGMQRGDFKSRTEGLARGIQTGQLTPNEARALENRPPKPKGDDLFMQGATVPIGTVLNADKLGHNGGPPLDEEGNDGDDDA